MNYDGQAEVEAILARFKVLAGGRVYETVPDDLQELTDPMGRVKPHVILHFGEPILDKTDRTMVGDGEQPFILPVSAQYVASSEADLRALSSAGLSLIIDWAPTANSGTMQPTGAQSFPTMDSSNRVTRYNRIAHYPVTINLSRAA